MKTTMYCKRILAVALALLMVATAAILTIPQAEAAKIPESGNTCNIKAYTLQTSGNIRVYTNAACTTGGNEYISAASDECYIQKINPNYNSVYVSYPTKSGRKSRWVSISVFTKASGALTGSPVVMTASAKITTYKRNNTSAAYGSISAGDKVYLLETSGSMTRVVYPISGGWYKMAWALNTQLFPFSNGNYKIRTLLNTNYCIDVCGASQESGANVQVYHDNTESNAQNFAITHVKDGWYRIQNVGSGKVLDVANGSTSSGTNVWQYDWNGSDAQLWQIINTGNGYYLRNKLGCFLDVANGTATDSNNVWVYTFNGSNAQKFTFTGAKSPTPTPTNTEEAKITARLNEMMSGTYGNNTYKLWKKYTGPYSSEQCKGFAKQVHKILFGYNIGSTKGKPYNYQIGISGANTSTVGSLTNLSDTNLRNLFAKGRPGDFIQVRRSHTGSHSMIFLSADNNSVTVYECNLDNKNTIVKNTYSWSTFRSKNVGVSLYTANNYYLH